MFIPLYVRSEYSILKSTCHLDELVATCASFGYQALAITDEMAMHGAIKFYNACHKHHIKPIIGVKVPYTINGVVSNILLYAMDLSGYRNLMRICSKCKVTNNPIDVEDLRKFSLGVIGITPGYESIVYDWINKENYESLKQHLSILKDIFQHFFIGITLNTLNDRYNINNYLQYLTSLNYEMIALTPVFYLHPEDSFAYSVVKAIGEAEGIKELSEYEQNASLLSPDEVNLIFKDYPKLIENTSKVASLCNVEIKFGELQLPQYNENIDAKQYLLELSIQGLQKRIKQNKIVDSNVYYNRLRYEYETIIEMGFEDYFLIVYDYVKYAKNNKIFVGPGRGSVGACLIAYCLGITEIDPIEYNLLFERFLNKERVTMPDIDIDFPDNERDKVITYVSNKYTKSRVAHICAFGTFGLKLAINDISRVLKIEQTHLKHAMKLINEALDKNRHDNLALKDIIESDSRILQLMDEYEDIASLLLTAVKIIGLPRNISTHAAGIIITKYNLLNYTPLDNGLDGIYQTQYEASDLEAIGLLKMDFLGLRNLTNISKTCELIKETNETFTLPKEVNDPNVFKMLAQGDVTGVFQLESKGMRECIMNLKTSSIFDIFSALALYRPGPMGIIPTYIARKFGKEKVTYLHEDLKPILEETYGLIVYQEQIMMIARVISGYSLGRADILRRAVSKKKKEVLEKERKEFVENALKRGYHQDVVNKIYDYIVEFADYGFNKAHSVAYAKVAYLTAYLKYYYPTYYMSTLMTSFIGNNDDIIVYTKEALSKNIKVFAPSVNYSTDEFIPYQDGILFPLTNITNLGNVKASDIINERNTNGLFKSYNDFIIRTKGFLPQSTIVNMIYAGALDEFKMTKKAMIESIEQIIMMLAFEGIPGLLEKHFSNEEYPYLQLLDGEKNALGINLKYNFQTTFNYLYQNERLTKINDLRVDTYVQTLGKITKFKEIKTKNNELMAFATIEDDVKDIEIIIFPNVYSQFEELSVGKLIIVYGKMQKRNEQLQIVVDNIKLI